MRREELYLADIVAAADAVAGFVGGHTAESFTQDDLVRSAVLQKLTTIGEAVAHLSLPLRERHPEVDWPIIVGFRNRAIHAYFAVDWLIVWETAVQIAPELREQVAAVLAAEFPADVDTAPSNDALDDQ